MADRHYIGEVGTEIIVDCGVDITGATNTKLKIKKPDGTEVEWVAIVYNSNYLKYISIAGDFNIAGDYYLNSYIETTGGWDGHGETAIFRIYALYET